MMSGFIHQFADLYIILLTMSDYWVQTIVCSMYTKCTALKNLDLFITDTVSISCHCMFTLSGRRYDT